MRSRGTPITKGLIIASPHIENILAGRKTWEIRSRHFHYRGPLALVKKGSGAIYGVHGTCQCGNDLWKLCAGPRGSSQGGADGEPS